ncbi:MAG TPA: class I SAM-dependent methyltransferase [Novimethylophilus sp.]|jgi:SAM-dependent methyltransferase|uniref:class I SAM-dependent methyltransferase n=1 Tax=Novimethylophilus sp. TaxID=2137426 RepID=UPI002F3EB5CA
MDSRGGWRDNVIAGRKKPHMALDGAGNRMPSKDMKLNPQDLERITTLTLQHYNQYAQGFWDGTRHHDVSQNIATLLQYIEGDQPHTILDFGCGPGRDLKVFAELGHCAVGLEGAVRFAEMARAYSGCEVWQQDFLQLDLPRDYFDGVFANAALFHVPSQELPAVLLQLHVTLKPGGVLLSSNPCGNNSEGWNGGRYGAYYDLDAWRQYMVEAGFIELTHYYRPAGLPREQQPWLASVWRSK